MGIKQLTSLVPTEDDADLEYCTSLLPVDRFIQNRGSQGRGRRRISRYDNQIGKEVQKEGEKADEAERLFYNYIEKQTGTCSNVCNTKEGRAEEKDEVRSLFW